jgi:uncharacterized protein
MSSGGLSYVNSLPFASNNCVRPRSGFACRLRPDPDLSYAVVSMADNLQEPALKTQPDMSRQWKCMSHCGACCFLGDYDLPVLDDMLRSPDDVELYLSMIGPDGWCVHFDKFTRACQTYKDRPKFCRVELGVFRDMYGTTDELELNEFAIACCEEHIEDIYPALSEGETVSAEMARFRRLTTPDACDNASGSSQRV